jgi:hypothetical protein
MSKTLCDWSKSDFEKDFLKLTKIVSQPLFACRKCGRAANNPKFLCKPRELEELPEEKDSAN